MFGSQNKLKIKAAEAALSFIKDGCYLGVGTGSTVNCFIEFLAQSDLKPKKIVASSKATQKKLNEFGFEVTELNYAGNLDVYIDGADEINARCEMIKGGGGALTGEKILASVSKQFICIADESKQVNLLGKFPLAVEVVSIAQSAVARQLTSQFSLTPELREGFVSDYGNIILDNYGLSITNPKQTEQEINSIAGVVCNGIFALRPADVALIAGKSGVRQVNR